MAVSVPQPRPHGASHPRGSEGPMGCEREGRTAGARGIPLRWTPAASLCLPRRLARQCGHRAGSPVPAVHGGSGASHPRQPGRAPRDCGVRRADRGRGSWTRPPHPAWLSRRVNGRPEVGRQEPRPVPAGRGDAVSGPPAPQRRVAPPGPTEAPRLPPPLRLRCLL